MIVDNVQCHSVLPVTEALSDKSMCVPSWVDECVSAIEKNAISLRHEIHQHPELGNMEINTAKLVANLMLALGIQVQTGVGNTGVVGILQGDTPGPGVALRADMDALPVEELTGLPFASKDVGLYHGETVPVMHACGHDAHTAILIGAAMVLAANKDKIEGTVVFIFQPAEEGAADVDDFDNTVVIGARAMIRDGVLDNPKVEAIFGLHVLAGYPTGHIFYRPGPVLNSNDGFRITVKGNQTHGSSPWTGSDSILASAKIIDGLQTLISRKSDLSKGTGVVSVGSIHGGTAENIIPESVLITGTIRTNSPDIRKQILDNMPPLVEHIATAFGTEAAVKIAAYGPVTVNDPYLTNSMLPALDAAAPGKVHLMPNCLAPSEDFSYFSERIPGLYVLVGATPEDKDMASEPFNHSPHFTVDDATLATGIKAHIQFVLNYPNLLMCK
ncbi:amidohydrolase [Pseudomonas sp. CG7]|uniref:amidohydrolase n=1 Tax=Pseudomonas sp. CG7 TaxID=191007 RepID=UPI003336D571|nr:amidohydrolase [Pseudomonas sp. CG7]